MVEPRAQVLLEAAVYRPIKRLPPERLRPVIWAGRSFRLIVLIGTIRANSFHFHEFRRRVENDFWRHN